MFENIKDWAISREGILLIWKELIIQKHFKYIDYMCDIEGNIYSLKTNKYLTAGINSAGYRVVTLTHNKVRKQYRVHRFIMEAFLNREIKQEYVINHIDGDKSNNKLSNLEEITYSDNTKHAVRLGLMKPQLGENNGMSFLTEDCVRNIIRNIQQGYDNSVIAEEFKIEDKHVSLIRNKKRWEHIFLEDEFKNYKVKHSRKETNIPDECKREIKSLLLNTNMKLVDIANKYNIHPSIISRVQNNLVWKHI